MESLTGSSNSDHIWSTFLNIGLNVHQSGKPSLTLPMKRKNQVILIVHSRFCQVPCDPIPRKLTNQLSEVRQVSYPTWAVSHATWFSINPHTILFLTTRKSRIWRLFAKWVAVLSTLGIIIVKLFLLYLYITVYRVLTSVSGVRCEECFYKASHCIDIKYYHSNAKWFISIPKVYIKIHTFPIIMWRAIGFNVCK